MFVWPISMTNCQVTGKLYITREVRYAIFVEVLYPWSENKKQALLRWAYDSMRL
jgi:hypothetical protein